MSNYKASYRRTLFCFIISFSSVVIDNLDHISKDTASNYKKIIY